MSRAVLLLVALCALASPARADDLRLTLRGEGAVGLMLTDSYRDRFDVGGMGTARVGLELAGPLLELRLSGGGAGFPVPSQAPGTLYALGLGARTTIRVDEGPAGGPFLDADVMLALTGDLVRASVDVGVGWSFFATEEVVLGPVVRFLLLIQDPGDPVPDPASLLFFGLELGARIDLDGTPPPPPEPEPDAPDEDGDGIAGEHDRCPSEPEDVDAFADDDGCPDLDDDSDGFPDEEDVCPRLPESRNGFDDEDGCPDEAPPPPGEESEGIRHGAEGTPLPHHVYFRVGSPRVSPRYAAEIGAVCDIVNASTTSRIRVVGHADEQGTAAANHRLGAERAGAVAEQLVLCGIDPTRIESTSYGDARPACTESTEECRELRRRVEFELIEPTD